MVFNPGRSVRPATVSRFQLTTRLIALLLIVLTAGYVVAQSGSTSGRIAGTIQDPTGAVVPNATIVVKSTATGTIYTATSSSEGAYTVPELSVGLYTVSIEAKGFGKRVYSDVKVDAGRVTTLLAVLEIGVGTEVVEVKANQEVVNTTSSEVNTTVNTVQVQNLPLNGRGVVGLLAVQANVVAAPGRVGTTSLSGARPAWSQVTLDGINVQDIFIRTNALDFIPNRPSTEAVSEFTVLQGAEGANAALGANGLKMTIKSGTNAYHGGLYLFNRNSALAANEWFNNHSKPAVKIPFLNRNELGGNFGGPIKKNKLFFFFAYDGLFNHTQGQLNQIVPAHDDYLQGVFRYLDSSNTLRQVNVLTGAGMQAATVSGQTGVLPQVFTVDPKIQSAFIAKINGASTVNNFLRGDSTSSMLKNTAGYLRNQSANQTRHAETAKLDYEISASHHIDLTAQRIHEKTLRGGYDPINVIPQISNDSYTGLYTGSWRWTLNNSMVNSVRIGGNRAPGPFNSSASTADGFLFNSGTSSTSTVSGIGLTSSQVFFQPQGRISTAHQYGDDFSWIKGSHSFQFGGTLIQWNVWSYDYGINPYVFGPIISTGFSGNAAAKVPGVQLVSGMFPGGISSADVTTANGVRAFLAGIVSSASQQFYVASKTSGFVPGQMHNQNLTLKDWAFYGMDSWRVLPNFTVNYGLRWEYISPYKDINGLQLGPVWKNPNDPVTTMLDPGATVDFMKQAYRPDYNNFAPSIGFAWDPFKDGKSSIRAGYSIAFVNDDTFRAAGNAIDGNAGLSSSVSLTGLYQPFSAGVTVPSPTFKMPRTLADQLGVASTSALFGIDPNVRTPFVHNIYFGIEREVAKNTKLTMRYTATLGRDLLRGIDYNQTNAGINKPYLTDFLNARNNGYLSSIATGGKSWDPRYDPTIPGSQPLPYFATITNLMANITNSSAIGYLQQNQPGVLADWMYGTNPGVFTNARSIFLPNSGIYAADLILNGGETSYHSGVVEMTHRVGNTQIQANYTWSKNLSNTPGDTGQTRFDPMLDNARPGLMKGYSNYDLRHQFKINAVYQLPVGRGKWLLSDANSVVDRIVGGWTLSGIWSLQSGAPFSILSNRGTFNRGGRSTYQTAVSGLSQDDIKSFFGHFQTANGNLYYINPNVIGADGKAVGADNQFNTGSTAFNQIFFNPGAGQVGNLGLLAFSGPRYTNFDMRLAKTTKITERVNFELGIDAFNVLNHPVFFMGDTEVNSTSFGRITGTNNSSRKLQIGGRLSF